MEFDIADIPTLIEQGLWNTGIRHEMGHVMGMLDFVWSRKNLVRDQFTPQWSVVGQTAMEEFGKLQDPGANATMAELYGNEPTTRLAGAVGGGVPVPIEDNFGPGTQGSHWRENVFGNEMMTGFIDRGLNPLSRITGGALKDIGYAVDLDACDDYTLPSPTALAMMGALTAGRMHG